jgi:hypothetical protein
MPVIRHPGVGDTSGRGLMLVDTLSSAWGVEPDARGKQVWFTLDLAAPAGGAGHDQIVDDFDEEALVAAFPDTSSYVT